MSNKESYRDFKVKFTAIVLNLCLALSSTAFILDLKKTCLVFQVYLSLKSHYCALKTLMKTSYSVWLGRNKATTMCAWNTAI